MEHSSVPKEYSPMFSKDKTDKDIELNLVKNVDTDSFIIKVNSSNLRAAFST